MSESTTIATFRDLFTFADDHHHQAATLIATEIAAAGLPFCKVPSRHDWALVCWLQFADEQLVGLRRDDVVWEIVFIQQQPTIAQAAALSALTDVTELSVELYEEQRRYWTVESQTGLNQFAAKLHEFHGEPLRSLEPPEKLAAVLREFALAENPT